MKRFLVWLLVPSLLLLGPACSDDGGMDQLGSGGLPAGVGGVGPASGGAAAGGSAAGGTSAGGSAAGGTSAGGSAAGGSAAGGAPSGGTSSTGGNPSGGASSGGAEGASGGATSSGGAEGSGGGEPVDCTYVPDPILGEGEPQNMVGATAAHNEWRVRVGLPPLVWDEDLAAGAQGWADTCPEDHSTNEYRSDVAGFGQVGENLYSGTDVLHGIQLFADERYDYEFGMQISQNNFTPIGHYTQIVWSDTTAVGCAVGDCGTWRTVCWYGPAGNYIGEAPYGEAEGACLDLDNDDVFQWEDADDTDREVD